MIYLVYIYTWPHSESYRSSCLQTLLVCLACVDSSSTLLLYASSHFFRVVWVDPGSQSGQSVVRCMRRTILVFLLPSKTRCPSFLRSSTINRLLPQTPDSVRRRQPRLPTRTGSPGWVWFFSCQPFECGRCLYFSLGCGRYLYFSVLEFAYRDTTNCIPVFIMDAYVCYWCEQRKCRWRMEPASITPTWKSNSCELVAVLCLPRCRWLMFGS